MSERAPATMAPAIRHHGGDRLAFHAAAAAALARAGEGAYGVAQLCTYAFRCPVCLHVDHSGPRGGALTACRCDEQGDRFITVLFAGEAYDLGLASELG